MEVGVFLSSEEHPAAALVRTAADAEHFGFTSCAVSDHFHPWSDSQGHSPFVWATLGGLAVHTTHLDVTTLVTCPILRMHPGLVAHAAATVATMMPGRFALGVGTGERLNEHVLGHHWPPQSVRLEMLAEAISVMRELWSGRLTTFVGQHFSVENAKLYDVPSAPVPILVAADGPDAVELAAQMGDGMVSTRPDAELVGSFRDRGGEGRPVVGMVHVCVAGSTEHARRVAERQWPTAAVPHELNAELPLPQHFEAAAEAASGTGSIVLGNDVEEHVEALRAYRDAGFDRLYVHQVGGDQMSFLALYADEVLPAFKRSHSTANV
jgi:G6PDH family F420-dependent oxidoreductase